MIKLRNNSILLILFVLLYIFSHHNLYKIQNWNDTIAEHRSWRISPFFLELIAGEFKGIVANILTLEIGSQLGTEIIRSHDGTYKEVTQKVNWPRINRMFGLSQHLDPYFQQTYWMAQGFLPSYGYLQETMRILSISAEYRYWDWRPTHLLGFNHYFYLNDFGKAGKLFLEASKVKNAPSFLVVLGGRLAKQGGETKTAIAMMKSILRDKPETEPGFKDMHKRLIALEDVWELEKARDIYYNSHGRFPLDLSELVEANIIKSIPTNPYKNSSYCIDNSGVIYFDNLDCTEN